MHNITVIAIQVHGETERNVESLLVIVSFQRRVIHHALHEISPDRQCRAGTSSVTYPAEMHLHVLEAYPCPGSNPRSISDEPSVRIAVGSTCLAGHRPLKPEAAPKAISRTSVDNTLHQVRHKIGRMLTESLMLRSRELSKHIAHIVLNACNEQRRDMHTLRRECVVCCDHLIQRYVGSTYAKRRNRVKIAPYAHFPHHLHHCIRTELLHQIGRNIVRALSKSPPESHHVAYILVTVGTLRSPYLVRGNDECLRHIRHPVARGHALLHGKSI